VVEIEGAADPEWLWIAPQQWRFDRENRLRFVRSEGYPPGPEDVRPLSVQLLALRLIGPTFGWRGSAATAGERASIGVRLAGHYGLEIFGDAGRGVWLEPHAILEAAAGPGRLVLTMSAPRPEPPETVLRMAGKVVAGPLDLDETPIEVVVPIEIGEATNGVVRLSIESLPYVPALAGRGGDRRALGAVLWQVAFEAAEVSDWARPFPRPPNQ
jgi:hypothetical protein